MIEKLDFQNKMWQVIAKVEGNRLDDPSTLALTIHFLP